MRKLLLATSAMALALTFAASAGAEPSKVVSTATTVAPPETTTTDGLVFSKGADQAKPIDRPGSRMAPSEQADQPTKPVEAAEPAAPTVALPNLSAEDAAVAAQLKELIETKFSQSVPREADRAGVLAFYKARNFAPIWIASGKSAWEIGEILAISKRTVDEHTQAALRKLGAANRTQAVAIAMRDRIIAL